MVSPASWLVQACLLPPSTTSYPCALATEQRTHFREPVAHLGAASSLPARGLANPGNSWADKCKPAPFLCCHRLNVRCTAAVSKESREAWGP